MSRFEWLAWALGILALVLTFAFLVVTVENKDRECEEIGGVYVDSVCIDRGAVLHP